jgi:hypothetical protein
MSPCICKKRKFIAKHLRQLALRATLLTPNNCGSMSSDVQVARRYRFGVFQLDTFSGEAL